MKCSLLLLVCALVTLASICDGYCSSNSFFNTVVDVIKVNDDERRTRHPVHGCLDENFDKLIGPIAHIQIITPVKELKSQAIVNMKNLKSFMMYRNDLEKINSYTFSDLPSLRTISLAENELTALPERTFHNLNVTFISLQKNKISSISRNAFSQLSNLKVLYLHENQLKEMQSFWFHESTTNLLVLNLESNLIEKIHSESFKDFDALGALSLGQNMIHTIETGAFNDTTYLLKLYLNLNRLTDLGALKILRHLQELDLSANQIMYLDEEFFKSKTSADSILLTGNPIKCSCIKEMDRWGDRNDMKIIFYERHNPRSIPLCVVPKVRDVCEPGFDEEAYHLYINALLKISRQNT